MKKFSVVLTLILIMLMTGVVHATSITASVNGQSGPWNVSLNPSYSYGVPVGTPNYNLDPTVVADGLNITPGGTLTIAWISGNVCGGAGGGAWTDGANGDAGWSTCYTPSACQGNPSYYIPANQFPVVFMELIGVFANSAGVIVGNPFVLGNGPKTVTIPDGASQLQLGFDDGWYNDNFADLQVCVSDTVTGCGIFNPPVANAGPDQIIAQTSDAEAEVVLDGSASTDDGLPQPLTYTWSWNGGSATGVSPTVTLPLGTTTVTLTVFDGHWYDTDTVNITVRDTIKPLIWCKEGVNPSGKNVPKSKNPDGFYQIFTSDVGGSAPLFWVGTADNPMLFGPAPSGIYIKLTEAPGVEPSYKLIGNTDNVLIYHVFLPSDAVFTTVDSSGNTSTCKCLVPPPPK